MKHQATHKNNYESTVNSDSRLSNKNANSIERLLLETAQYTHCTKGMDMSNSTKTPTPKFLGNLNATSNGVPYLTSKTVAYSYNYVSGSEGARELILDFKTATPVGKHVFGAGQFTKGFLTAGLPGPGGDETQYVVVSGYLDLTEVELYLVKGTFEITLAGTGDPTKTIRLRGEFDIHATD